MLANISFMQNSLFLKIVLILTFLLFVVALGLIVWFFYLQKPLHNTVPIVNDVETADPFEGLSPQESDRKALELLTPQTEDNTQKQNNTADLELLLGGSKVENENSATSSTSSDESNFFDIQPQAKSQEQISQDLDLLLNQ